MNSPLPDLQIHPSSGLSFAWAEYHEDNSPSFTASLSSDGSGGQGVGVALTMLINWFDLCTACQEILGYSYRPSAGLLNRIIPWQHPYWNQLYARSISSVHGIQLQGTSQSNPDDNFNVAGGGMGPGAPINTGPWTEYSLAKLVISFWRPPYYIRTDADIVVNGVRQEWLRYVDKFWEVNTQMLSREGNTFGFSGGQGLDGRQFQGAVGQPVAHLKLKKTWYQVPEQCLFQPLVDATLNGLPHNQLYTQTATTNPITGYTYPAGSPITFCVNSPSTGIATDNIAEDRFFGCIIGTLRYDGCEFTPIPLQLPPYLMNIPAFEGNEAISQVQYNVTFHFDLFIPPGINASQVNTVGSISIVNPGTAYVVAPAVTITPVGAGAGATAVAVLDGAGHVILIRITNPGAGYTTGATVAIAAGPGVTATATASVITTARPSNWAGHNLMPYSGNGLWYAVQSQQPPITTPLQYACLQNLFVPL